MSQDTTATTPLSPRLLHTWEVTIDQTVPETTPEVRDGQTIQITRNVVKAVATRFAIKQPTHRELRAADLFYGKRQNWYVANGFLPRSIMINKHLDLSGGVLSEKERLHAVKLAERHIELESELTSSSSLSDTVKADIQKKLTAVRTEMINLNTANEMVFSQTAEARAQNDLRTWFSLFLTLVERNGKWVPLFDGENYEAREEAMWNLEEKEDPLYLKATDTIALHTQVFLAGGNTPETFKLKLEWLEEEMKKQREVGEETAAPTATPAAAPEEPVAPAAEPAAVVP